MITVMTPPVIEFDRARLVDLKKAHAQAEEEGLEGFTFLGHDLLTSYAKYLIIYLEGALR